MPRKNRRNRRRRSSESKKRRWFAPFAIMFLAGSIYGVPRLIKLIEKKSTTLISQVKVVGASAIPSIDLQKLSGLTKGIQLSFEKEAEAVKKLNTHPRLASVAIVRDLTGEVAIHVQERDPVAMIQLEKLYYLDEHGNILDSVHSKDYKQTFMVITGAWTRAQAKERAVEAMQIRKELIDGGLTEKMISELHYDAHMGWLLYHVGVKASMILGKDRISEKAQRIKAVLSELKSRREMIQEIDLDYSDQAIVKLEGEL